MIGRISLGLTDCVFDLQGDESDENRRKSTSDFPFLEPG